MITCPRCDAQYAEIPALASHIAFSHSKTDDMAMTEAQRAARACPGCGRATGSHSKACLYRSAPAATTPAPPPQPPPVAPAPKEAVMADTKPCAKCKKPFTPTDGRQKHCDACSICGSCKEPGRAHKDWCKRGKGKAARPATAKKPTGGGTRRKLTRATKKNGRAVPRELDARVAAKLDEAKADVTRLRGELSRAEVKVELFQELVGA